MNVVARTDGWDWIVEVDGIVRARFAYTRFGPNAAFLAAREANVWRAA